MELEIEIMVNVYNKAKFQECIFFYVEAPPRQP
jgi:hypothetical protein